MVWNFNHKKSKLMLLQHCSDDGHCDLTDQVEWHGRLLSRWHDSNQFFNLSIYAPHLQQCLLQPLLQPVRSWESWRKISPAWPHFLRTCIIQGSQWHPNNLICLVPIHVNTINGHNRQLHVPPWMVAQWVGVLWLIDRSLASQWSVFKNGDKAIRTQFQIYFQKAKWQFLKHKNYSVFFSLDSIWRVARMQSQRWSPFHQVKE